jgi:ABC-type phosphate/phosphonate transport system substrate-binding protein
LPSPIPAGFAENPLQLVVVAQDNANARASQAELSARLLELSDVNVNVVVANRSAEAISALCRSGVEAVSAVWVSGLGYASARASGCGEALLRLELTDGRNDALGYEGVMLYSRRMETNAISDSAGKTFCRLGYDDVYSWVLPTLILRNAGVNPDTLRVRDYDDITSLLKGFVDTVCDVTALRFDVYDTLVEDGAEGIGQLRVVLRSQPLPAGVLFVSPLLPSDKQARLIEALLDLSRLDGVEEATPAPDDDTAEATPAPRQSLLAPFFGDGRLVRVQARDFNALNSFLDATGVNFRGLGQ